MGKRGLVGYEGLGTLLRAGFRRPVQIVRQFISNLETLNSLISHIQRFVKHPQNGGESRRITYIPGRITNPISGICGYVDIKV